MKIVVDLPEWYLKGIQGIKLPHYVDELIMEGQPLSEVLDEIKGEIEDLEPENGFEGFYKCQSETLEIIDKHIGGEGDKE